MSKLRNEAVSQREFLASLILWTSGVIYSLWCLKDATWSRFNVDINPPDSEWIVFSRLFITAAPFFVAHFVLKRTLLSNVSTWTESLFHCVFSTCALSFLLGWRGAALVATVLFIYLLLSYIEFWVVTWACALASIYLFVMTTFLYSLADFFGFYLSDTYDGALVVILSWSVLRFISVSRDGHLSRDFLVRLGFFLYFPILLVGPLMNFNVYLQGLNRNKALSDLPHYMFRIARYFMWGCALDYVYSHWDFHFTGVPWYFDLWTVCGLGYWLGQSFMIKYVVFYGIPSSFARLEGFEAPDSPKCIGRIHRYSDMWRNFDVGLYKFLIRYVHLPVVNATGYRLLGVAASFALVSFWHAMTKSVFIWVSVNAAGILLEQVLDAKVLPSVKSARLKCVILTPVLIASALSNFYFLGEFAVGNGIFWRVFECSLVGKFWIFFFMYHCSVSSAYIKEHESGF